MERFAHEWDIFMLNETFLKPDQHHFHINGFETVKFDRLYSNGGGIAFLNKRDVIFETIQIDFISSVLEIECNL